MDNKRKSTAYDKISKEAAKTEKKEQPEKISEPEKVEKEATETVKVSTPLNLRSSPGGEVLEVLTEGTTLTSHGASLKGWIKVTTAAGKEGHVMSQFVQKV